MTDYMNNAYELGKKHIRQELNLIPNLIEYIDSCGFTCDQLQEIIRGIEDLKGSDYESNFDDSDRSDELREYREGQS